MRYYYTTKNSKLTFIGTAGDTSDPNVKVMDVPIIFKQNKPLDNNWNEIIAYIEEKLKINLEKGN